MTTLEVSKELCKHEAICTAQFFLEPTIVNQCPYRRRTLRSPYQREPLSFCPVPGSWLTQDVEMFDLSASSCPAATLSLIRSLGLALSKHSSKHSREYEASPTHQPLEQSWRVFEEHHKPSTKALWRVKQGFQQATWCPELCMQWSLTLIPDNKILCVHKYNF